MFSITFPEFLIPPVKAVFGNHAHLPFPDRNLHDIRFQDVQNDGYNRSHILHSNRNGLNDFPAVDMGVTKNSAIRQRLDKYILSIHIN